MVEMPRSRSWAPPPGAPELNWRLAPASLPWRAESISGALTRVSAALSTTEAPFARLVFTMTGARPSILISSPLSCASEIDGLSTVAGTSNCRGSRSGPSRSSTTTPAGAFSITKLPLGLGEDHRAGALHRDLRGRGCPRPTPGRRPCRGSCGPASEAAAACRRPPGPPRPRPCAIRRHHEVGRRLAGRLDVERDLAGGDTRQRERAVGARGGGQLGAADADGGARDRGAVAVGHHAADRARRRRRRRRGLDQRQLELQRGPRGEHRDLARQL